MATRSPEVNEARAALARARTERQRAKALEDYNRAMGREPRRSEKEGYDYGYGRGYGRRYDGFYTRRW